MHVVCSEESQYLWVTVNQIVQMEFSRPTNMLYYVHTPFALVESPARVHVKYKPYMFIARVQKLTNWKWLQFINALLVMRLAFCFISSLETST